MNAEKIKNRIQECCTLFAFDFCGKDGNIDPFSQNDFHLRWGKEEKDVHSIDEVMNEPFFDGKSLTEIADKITITEW